MISAANRRTSPRSGRGLFPLYTHGPVAQPYIITSGNSGTSGIRAIVPSVLFKATGFWSTVDPNELDDAYRLASPVVVSINDNTQTISTLGTIALIPLVPLFPLVMMYGCATGPCV